MQSSTISSNCAVFALYANSSYVRVRFSYYFVLLLPAEQSTIASTNSTHMSGTHFAAMYFVVMDLIQLAYLIYYFYIKVKIKQ